MRWIPGALAAALLGTAATAQDAATSFDELLEAVRADALSRSEENRAREERFVASRDEQQALLDLAREELGAQNARSDVLKAQFDANEVDLAGLTETLQLRVGDMGELFGVVRQVAGDTKGIIDSSLVSAQLPDRAARIDELAQAEGMPSIDDLRSLYLLLLEEMAESGRVVRFDTEIVSAGGSRVQAGAIRVGVFNAISEGNFLRYEPQDRSLQVLARQPARRFTSLARGLWEATEGIVPMAIDPSRGAILGLLIQAPSPGERIRQGGLVGYIIILLGVLGALISIERLAVLGNASRKIRAQRAASTADEGNALGRVLRVYEENRAADTETLELKLDEAILRETPPLERWQGAIKVLAAVAPLLGLLGTVVGMIRTFQSITLFGTGDPRLMAGGISQALVTTVLGLVVAIPLVLLHSLVAGRSRELVEILEEQSAGMIARHVDRDLR